MYIYIYTDTCLYIAYLEDAGRRVESLSEFEIYLGIYLYI